MTEMMTPEELLAALTGREERAKDNALATVTIMALDLLAFGIQAEKALRAHQYGGKGPDGQVHEGGCDTYRGGRCRPGCAEGRIALAAWTALFPEKEPD